METKLDSAALSHAPGKQIALPASFNPHQNLWEYEERDPRRQLVFLRLLADQQFLSSLETQASTVRSPFFEVWSCSCSCMIRALECDWKDFPTPATYISRAVIQRLTWPSMLSPMELSIQLRKSGLEMQSPDEESRCCDDEIINTTSSECRKDLNSPKGIIVSI